MEWEGGYTSYVSMTQFRHFDPWPRANNGVFALNKVNNGLNGSLNGAESARTFGYRVGGFLF